MQGREDALDEVERDAEVRRQVRPQQRCHVGMAPQRGAVGKADPAQGLLPGGCGRRLSDLLQDVVDDRCEDLGAAPQLPVDGRRIDAEVRCQATAEVAALRRGLRRPLRPGHAGPPQVAAAQRLLYSVQGSGRQAVEPGAV